MNDLAKYSILIIEDEPVSAVVLDRILAENRYRVKRIGQGEDGLKLLEREDFDLVVLDLKLPDMEGAEVLSRIRRQYPLIKVIVITAYASVETAVAVMKTGAFSYLVKPFETDSLLREIERAGKDSRQSRERDLMFNNLALIYRYGKELEGQRELKSVAALSARYLADTAQIRTCVILLLDKAAGGFYLAGSSGLLSDISRLSRKRFQLDPAIRERLFTRKKAVLFPRLKDLPEMLENLSAENPRSLFMFPLHNGENAEGIALFLNPVSTELDDTAVRTIGIITEEIGRCLGNARVYLELKQQYLKTVSSLINAFESKSSFFQGHSEKVSALAVLIAERMELDDEDVELIRYAGLMHDIGKIGVSEQILLKDGELTDDERFELISHCIQSSNIVRKIDREQKAAPIILHHHERYDGGGYPQGLQAEMIPVGARVLAVADGYVAMISERPYRRALSRPQALNELKRCAGTQFDPRIVEVLVNILG